MRIQLVMHQNGIQIAFFQGERVFVNLPIKESVLAIKYELEVDRLLTKADRAVYFAQNL